MGSGGPGESENQRGNGAGRPLRASAEARDQEVARLERRLALLAEHLPEMIFRYEYLPEPRFDYVSPASVSIAGYTPDEHYADPALILDVVVPDDREILLDAVSNPAEEDQGEPLLLRWRHKDGSEVVTEQRWRVQRGATGEVEAIEGVVRNVTERIRRQVELEHEATHDSVTGLANLRLLEEELGHHLVRRHSDLVVAVLRLDRFAMVRDLVGRSSADAMLRDVGRRLRLVAPASGLVARGEDDLFWIVLPEAGRGDAEVCLQRLLSAFAEPVRGDAREVYLTVSAGARHLGPGADATVESLLNDADTALRAISGRGVRGTTQWFDPELHQRATERLELEHDLRVAVGDGEISVVYQPQVEMATGRLLGFEALARWNRPGHGPVAPDLFIAVAEESGLIADLGDHVLYSAARQFARWRAMGFVADQRVAVNVSRRQLGLPDLADSFEEIIAAAGLPPRALTIEVTETAVMEAGDTAAGQLERLKDAGVRISLDDFGTGHSSLAALRELPVDELKIDRTFVAHLVDSPANRAICAAMVALGHGLGLDLVAEGVETEEQAANLIDLGCTVGQGYLFSRPLAAADVLPLFSPGS